MRKILPAGEVGWRLSGDGGKGTTPNVVGGEKPLGIRPLSFALLGRRYTSSGKRGSAQGLQFLL